jgi:hypothetical protein
MTKDQPRRGNDPSARDQAVERARQQQHTGNHARSPGEDPDRYAGTRAGAENVEPEKRRREKPGS